MNDNELTDEELVTKLRVSAPIAREEGLRWTEKYLLSAADRIKLLSSQVAEVQGNPRDEYHTMDELYDYRMLYNALAFNEAAKHGSYPVVKSWRHSDGELCFGGGWFIVVATLPSGQVANHYKAEHWDLFQIPESEPPTYDGHTPQIAADRIRAVLSPVTDNPKADDEPEDARNMTFSRTPKSVERFNVRLTRALDPEPWACDGSHDGDRCRYDHKVEATTFLPRPEFEQDRSKYPGSSTEGNQ